MRGECGVKLRFLSLATDFEAVVKYGISNPASAWRYVGLPHPSTVGTNENEREPSNQIVFRKNLSSRIAVGGFAVSIAQISND